MKAGMRQKGMERAAVIGAMAALGMLIFPTAPPTLAAENAAPALTLPCTRLFQTFIVPVRVNDSRVLHCILDTGMPDGVFIMDPAKLAGADVAYAGPVKINGVGPGAASGRIATDATLRLADLEFPHQRVIVLDEPGELAQIGFDGAIGASIFARYVVQLDFAHDTLTFFDSAGFTPPAGPAIPLTIANTRPFVDAQVRDSSGEAKAVKLFIDTGASKSLSLNPEAGVPQPASVVQGVLSSGVGGDRHGAIGRIDALTLGGFTLDRVVCEFPEAGDNDRDGTIGVDLLRRFTVTLDYPNQRVFLEPNGQFDEPFAADASGLSLWPDASGRLRVRFVEAESAAGRAGVKVGDVIRTIDGKAFVATELSQVRQLFKESGKSVTLTLDRDGETIEIKLKLAQVI